MGKPLISDAQMRAIHTTMLRLREAAQPVRRPAYVQVETEVPVAMLTACLLQMRNEDVLVTEGEDAQARAVLQLAQEASFQPEVVPFTLLSAERGSVATLAAGYALAQSHYSHPGDAAPVTLALLQPGTPVAEAMRLAGEHRLPLILILRDEPNRPRVPLKAPENVEIVQVDAEDAVAVCRVMQESMLRARNRWGSVVLRAVTLPNTADPIVAFEAHLRRRGLLG